MRRRDHMGPNTFPVSPKAYAMIRGSAFRFPPSALPSPRLLVHPACLSERDGTGAHMNISTAGCLTVVGTLIAGAAWSESAPPPAPPYADDPTTIATLNALGEGAGLYLPPCKAEGKGIEMVSGFSKRGPSVRDYGNKMVYAPDRQTGMYAGANHGAPHRLNDVSEYHLGSNAWHLILAPVGGDQGRIRRTEADIKAGKDIDKNKAFLTNWFATNVAVTNGYIQTQGGGPLFPWHTWDGLAYDASARRLLWAVLDNDSVQDGYLKTYAEQTGQELESLKRQHKPGTGLYLFDPATGWQRQIGPDPRPYLRGMGGSLTYIPELKKTIWYCAAENVTPTDFAMWAYDAAANTWTDLKPNGGKSIRDLVHVDKVAPGDEVQMAWSSIHKKLVAVREHDTFVYDLASNAWSKVCSDARNQASDQATVFAYDSNADVFLLLNDYKGTWDLARELRAFDLKTATWETIVPKGYMVTKPPYCGTAGYYDEHHNVFVVYNSTERVWVYRHKPTRKK